MRYRIAGLTILLAMLVFVVPAHSAVEIYQVRCGEQVPVWINYTLNCPADVTIKIIPAGGSTPVWVATLPSQARGKHQYLWTGMRDGDMPAPEGAYYAEITACSNQTQWDPIVGIFKNDDWTHEYSPRPLPSCPNSEGFYGIGINKNPASPYYGRIYVSHKVQKHVFMYDPDGEFLGWMDDSSVTWSSSAPWDISIAEDDYVYVDDRTSRVIHCFTPDGRYVSTSPPLSYSKAIFARRDASGVTHIFQTGGPTVRQITLAADHVTWGTPCNAFTPGTNNLATLGIWVSPDLTTIYNCYSEDTGTTNPGLTRWQASGSCSYSRDSWTSTITNPVVDVDMGKDGTYLWVTRMVGSESGRALHKVRLSNGTPYYPPDADYDVVSCALMCCTDGVGNIGVTFGKATSTWAQYYWGVFAEPGVSRAVKSTAQFVIGPNSSPIVVPGSAEWTFSNPDYPGRLPADDVSSASIEFKIYDPNGWTDIAQCTLDLSSLGGGVQPVDSITQDTSDPGGCTAVARKETVTVARGAGCGLHRIPSTVSDYRGGLGSGIIDLQVAGARISGYICHTRYSGGIAGATARFVGGGILGGQDSFTYALGPTDASGYFEGEVSEGAFQVSAVKPGFASAGSTGVSVSMPASPPASCMSVGTIYLRPCTVAEVRALTDGTQVNIEGVCCAWPVGSAPTSASGLAPRVDTQTSRNQWYICDPNDPDNGMLCLLTLPDPSFTPQWDDPAAVDSEGISTYLGKRPALGETIMFTGLLDTPSGHERRILGVDSDLRNAVLNHTPDRCYQNRGSLGGLPATPTSVTCASIARNDSAIWGRFVSTTAWIIGPKSGLAGTLIIADSTGTTELLLETPSSLGIADPPMAGCMYTIAGTAGRTGRYGNGCIRVRGPGDMSLVPGSCGTDELASIRSMPSGASVRVGGVVTGKWADFFYIEDQDRQAGIRVQSNSADAAVGCGMKIIGVLGADHGERVIDPTVPPILITSGNPVCAPYDLRTRDIGGAGFDPSNPGVTAGRSALNVGLRVHLQGMVTARDPGGQWFCIWDGANYSDAPVSDGAGRIGVRVRSTLACTPWVDWVDVTGIVSADSSIVPGRVTPVVLATSASKVTSFGSVSELPHTALASGWNLISLPAAPAGMGSGDEYLTKPWDAFEVLGPTKDPGEIDGRMYRWENCTGSLTMWDMWSEVGSHGPFGGLVIGDGYWLNLDADWPVSYSARVSDLDEWTGICAPGWAIVGQPKDHKTLLSDLKVHDGSSVVSMYDAVITNAWVDCIGYWWDNQTQSLVDIGIDDCFCSTNALEPWHGYWMQFYKGDLALITPETPAAP